MFASIQSFGVRGLSGFGVAAEADISGGLPGFTLVGLPDSAVKESADRVRSACKNLKFPWPASRITVNLAPADIRKTGPVYDLPVLLALLCASELLPPPGPSRAFVGELSLDGSLRPVAGVLPMALQAAASGVTELFVPSANAAEAAVAEGITIYPAQNAGQVVAHLRGESLLAPAGPTVFVPDEGGGFADFADVHGQMAARRALEIAAAGGHNILLIGPPGTGKSMLARRLPGILPPLTREEAVEITGIYSVAGLLPPGSGLVTARPFRSPHHSVSAAALSGGGSAPRPGEVSLAHGGVLFLDELPEFRREALEVLRQPLEDGTVTVSRVAGSATYPSRLTLAAAMNPCRCGYFGHPTRPCTCLPSAIERYRQKISGPLLDRIDLHVEAAPVAYDDLAGGQGGEPSAAIRARVTAARAIQAARYGKSGIRCNAQLPGAMVRRYCRPDPEAAALLRGAFEKLGLSARAYDRVLRVARTIADLDAAAEAVAAGAASPAGGRPVRPATLLSAEHLAEALQYRSLDRKYWYNA